MAHKLTTQQAKSFNTQLDEAQRQINSIVASRNGILPSAPQSPVLSAAQTSGASGRGTDNYSEDTTNAIKTAVASGVPISALGDPNSSGKTNLEKPKSYSAPTLSSASSKEYLKAFGLEGVIDPNYLVGMTAQQANDKALALKESHVNNASQVKTNVFDPVTLKGAKTAIDKFGFALNDVGNSPFEPKNLKQDSKNTLLSVTSKELGGLFTSPNDVYNTYQYNPQMKATLDKFISSGGKLADIAGNVSTPVVQPLNSDGSNIQDSSSYLANLRNPQADKKAQDIAVAELAPESDISQKEILRQSQIPENLQKLYFGDEKTMGILQMKQQQYIQEKINLEERLKDEKINIKAKAELRIQQNNAEVAQQTAEIEQNRLTAKNYITARLASLGALQTTGAAPLAISTLDATYSGKVGILQSKLRFANQATEIGLQENLDNLENNTNDKILKIQSDLTKDSETVAKEVLKAQQDADNKIASITNSYVTKLRERTITHTTELKREAEAYAKKFAKIVSPQLDFTASGLPGSKSRIVSQIEQKLEASRGSDGYVNSVVYKQALKDWIAKGGTTTSFKSKFPTVNYANPNDTSLPPALSYAKESQTLPKNPELTPEEMINRLATAMEGN